MSFVQDIDKVFKRDLVQENARGPYIGTWYHRLTGKPLDCALFSNSYAGYTLFSNEKDVGISLYLSQFCECGKFFDSEIDYTTHVILSGHHPHNYSRLSMYYNGKRIAYFDSGEELSGIGAGFGFDNDKIGQVAYNIVNRCPACDQCFHSYEKAWFHLRTHFPDVEAGFFNNDPTDDFTRPIETIVRFTHGNVHLFDVSNITGLTHVKPKYLL